MGNVCGGLDERYGGSYGDAVVTAPGRKRAFIVPTAELVDVSTLAHIERRSLPNNYPLVRQEASNRWACNACRTVYSKGFHSYASRQDDYDICPDCIIGPASPKLHVLSKQNVGTRWGCDGCGSVRDAHESSNGCREDNYDLCDACFRKGKAELVKQAQQAGGMSGPPPPIPPSGRTRSLFVGINYPGTSAELKGCVNDVTVILKLLEDRMQFDVRDRRIYVDERGYPGKTGEPTKQNILDGLRWLVEGANPGDALFFHYSGHGTKVADRDGDDDDGYDEALVPGDYSRAGMILDDDIYKIVLRDLKPGVRLTAITDCCHSGTIMDLEYQFVWTGENFGRPKRRTRSGGSNVVTRDCSSESKKPCDADVVQFSGCKDTQTSADTHTSGFENPYDGPGFAGGACTNAFTELFTKYDDLSYGQLLTNMQGLLKQKRYTQIPQLSSSCKLDMTQKFSLTAALDTGK